MINFGGGAASVVGIALIVAAAALYFIRSFRPHLSRDYDIFFSAVALICGGILLFQGWRLDPVLLLGQVALAGSAAFFAFENIRLRGITTEQAKRATPVVDDERPVSRVYRAELDELPYSDYGSEYAAVDERSSARRIRGTVDPRADRYDEYDSDFRRSSSRKPPERRLESSDFPPPARRSSRPPRPSRMAAERPDRAPAWEEDRDRPNTGSASADPAPRRAPSREASMSQDAPTSRRSRRRPSDAAPRPDESSASYADYQPIEPYPRNSADPYRDFS